MPSDFTIQYYSFYLSYHSNIVTRHSFLFLYIFVSTSSSIVYQTKTWPFFLIVIYELIEKHCLTRLLKWDVSKVYPVIIRHYYFLLSMLWYHSCPFLLLWNLDMAIIGCQKWHVLIFYQLMCQKWYIYYDVYDKESWYFASKTHIE